MIQPLVLNFCDCLDHHHDESFTYILQLTDITLHHTTLTITKRNFLQLSVLEPRNLKFGSHCQLSQNNQEVICLIKEELTIGHV